MEEEIVQLIVNKLEQVKSQTAKQYQANKLTLGIGYCVIDDLLPTEYANNIYLKFDPKNPNWRRMDSFRESKLTTKQYDQYDILLKQVTFAFQDQRVVKIIEEITGIYNQLPDSQLYAGGLSMMNKGDFLDPHIDNSHDQSQKVYRRLNLLYYVTPGWELSFGGNLELWDAQVKKPTTILSAFNRLVLMETHDLSWHSVSKVNVNHANRCCVSNYYFSEDSPNGKNYFHVTSFMARPEQPIKRMVCAVDNQLRMLVRKFKKTGFVKKDVYVKKA